tara:strand:+ start:1684 stop:1902 length:219 start_codon:yes stop_codon:yes gene_type:complete
MNQLLTDLVKEVGREKIAEITDVHVSTTYRWMSDNEDRPSTYIPMHQLKKIAKYMKQNGFKKKYKLEDIFNV